MHDVLYRACQGPDRSPRQATILHGFGGFSGYPCGMVLSWGTSGCCVPRRPETRNAVMGLLFDFLFLDFRAAFFFLGQRLLIYRMQQQIPVICRLRGAREFSGQMLDLTIGSTTVHSLRRKRLKFLHDRSLV